MVAVVMAVPTVLAAISRAPRVTPRESMRWFAASGTIVPETTS
jgi:hypothetical protein